MRVCPCSHKFAFLKQFIAPNLIPALKFLWRYLDCAGLSFIRWGNSFVHSNILFPKTLTFVSVRARTVSANASHHIVLNCNERQPLTNAPKPARSQSRNVGMVPIWYPETKQGPAPRRQPLFLPLVGVGRFQSADPLLPKQVRYQAALHSVLEKRDGL